MNTSTSTHEIVKISPDYCSKVMSNRYEVMDTTEIIEQICKTGLFDIAEINTKNCRKESRKGQGPHIVKLRYKNPVTIGFESFNPEVVIMNSYDGSCPLRVFVGIYRVVCSNGLIICTKDFGSFHVRHMGTPAEVAYSVVEQFLENLKISVDTQKEMSQVQLSQEQVEQFKLYAIRLRYKDTPDDADLSGFANPLRPEDEGMSLWTVYNRIQEALTLGGFKVGSMKRSSKKIKDVVVDNRLNQQLFQLAHSYIPHDVDYQTI